MFTSSFLPKAANAASSCPSRVLVSKSKRRSAQDAAVGALLDLLGRMAGHQRAVALVVDDEMLGAHPSFASFRFSSLAVTPLQ
jgi:hypothetical protein